MNLAKLIGTHHVLFVTLDTLRYDAAQAAWESGELPTLERHLPDSGWEKRHSPGSFTYSAHHAFFAGFLPTPVVPGPHPRLYAAEFAGSVSTSPETFTFQEATLPEALALRDYRTICIGGTGFFNQQTRLSQVLPSLFQEAYWTPETGVSNRDSAGNQVDLALSIVSAASDKPLLLFVNVAAIHQPNWFYGGEEGVDTLATHKAALIAVDKELDRLFKALRSDRPIACILCSDHGTAYGEDGHWGHRCGHEVVWTVPYAEFVIHQEHEE